MKHFFYFSNLGIIAQIEYDQDCNTFSYSTHRPLTFTERILIEQYLLYDVAFKQTKFYEITPATFKYHGVEKCLADEVGRAVEMQAEREAAASESEIGAAIKNVADGAMRNFYFDKICEMLEGGGAPDAQKLGELVALYNTHADDKITVDALLKK